MKHTWLAASLLAVCSSAWAQQQPSQEELIKKRDAKLGEAWIKDGGWRTDWDGAREEAKKSGKLIFGYFTVTYFH